MNQSRTGSLIEACFNVAVGFAINWTANMLILPLFGFYVSGAQAFGIGILFTFISVARSYVLRRWFNGLETRSKLVWPVLFK
ncbi:MAG: DUF7220 family protein [Shewanella sp.]